MRASGWRGRQSSETTSVEPRPKSNRGQSSVVREVASAFLQQFFGAVAVGCGPDEGVFGTTRRRTFRHGVCYDTDEHSRFSNCNSVITVTPLPGCSIG